jgi:Ni/Co efflux regulator RcnB
MTVRWPICQKLQRSEPNGRVTWLAHRTVRCAMREQPPPTALLVVGAINTPNHPPFIASKFPAFKPHTRAIAFNTRHKRRDQILSQVRNHSNQISDYRERHLCSFELLRLDFFSSSFFLVFNSLVIKTRDTKLWWSL